MRRRDFLARSVGLAAVLALPRVARSQQGPSLPTIALFNSGTLSQLQTSIASFIKGLEETGFADGRNVKLEYYFAEGQIDRLPTLLRTLLDRRPALIVAGGGIVPVQLAMAATATIPIVFTSGVDPVANGVVASLNRPGGNVTGVTALNSPLDAKRLELLHELVPQAKKIGVVYNPSAVPKPALGDAARALDVELVFAPATAEVDLGAGFAALSAGGVHAVLEAADPTLTAWRKTLIALAGAMRLPAMYESSVFVDDGGLSSYGGIVGEAYRLAGGLAGSILKGDKPADLPVQQPTKFELAINLRTARALGIAVPADLLARADRVVE